MDDFGLECRVARFHNVYGPLGTYDGGREKAPAALCRKVINAKRNNENKIEVWGDGKQTRTFLYIDDCIEGTLRLFESDYSDPVNIGSDEQVSINQMIEIIESISGIEKLERIYQLDKPKGVRGRSSDNTKIQNLLKWEPSIELKNGLKETYNWILHTKFVLKCKSFVRSILIRKSTTYLRLGFKRWHDIWICIITICRGVISIAICIWIIGSEQVFI